MKRRRVLAVASAGGHWVQLLRLAPAWNECDVTYVTTMQGLQQNADAIADKLGQSKPGFKTVPEANRWQKLRLVRSLLSISLIVLRIRPHLIVTTGAAPGYFALLAGRLIGARTIWIDSIANVEQLSLSGRKAGKFATLWLTQWEHLSEPDGPDYRGSVL